MLPSAARQRGQKGEQILSVRLLNS
jgi:hypothetical protein